MRPLIGLVIVALFGVFVLYNYQYNISSSPKAGFVPNAVATCTAIPVGDNGKAPASSPSPSSSPCTGTCKIDPILPQEVKGNVNGGAADGQSAVDPLDSQVKALGTGVYNYLVGAQFSSALDQYLLNNSSNLSQSGLTSFMGNQLSQFNGQLTTLTQGFINTSANSASQALFNKDYTTLGLNYHGSGDSSGSFSGSGTYSGSYNYDLTNLKNLGSASFSINYSSKVFSNLLTGNAGYSCETNLGTGVGNISVNGSLKASLTLSIGSTSVTFSLNGKNPLNPSKASLTWNFGG